MAPGDISPFLNSKVTCEGLTTTPAAAKYQDFFCGDDNRENRERLLRDLGVEDETSPEGRDKLRRHQAWYNDKKRKERQGNLRFKQIAQERLDENHWPDEEEEEEEGHGQGEGLGLGQNNEDGEEGANDEVIISIDDDDNEGAEEGAGDEVSGGLGQDNCPDGANGGRGGNEDTADLALLRPQPRAPSLTVSNDGTLGADSVSIAAIQAHTRISQDVISKNTAICKMTQQMIHRTLRHSRGTLRSTLFPGIVPTIAFLCLVAAVFIHVGSQEGGFNVGTFGKAYFAGSAPNAQQLSSFDDFDFAITEKIANTGTMAMSLINSINIDVRESLMEIHRTRGVRPRSSSFQKGDGISYHRHDSTEASDAYVGKASGASGDSAAENSPTSLPPSSTPSSDSKLASTSSGASCHTVLSSTSKKGFDDDQKGPSVTGSEMTAADEIPPTSTYRCLSGSDFTSIDGASIVTRKGGGKSNAKFLDNNEAAECKTVSNVTKVSANATVSEDSPACISGGNATDSTSQNISSGDSNSSAPIDKGELPPLLSGTVPEPNIPLKKLPPSAPKVVVPPPDGGVHDSTTTAADGGDVDVEGTRGSGRSGDYNTHKRMGIVGMVARALWQYPMVCVFAGVTVTIYLAEWFYGIDIVSIFNSIVNTDQERLEAAQQLQEEQLDEVFRQLNG